jgi:hypothetical protein
MGDCLGLPSTLAAASLGPTCLSAWRQHKQLPADAQCLINPLLSTHAGLTALKTGAVAFDPLSLITSFKSLCDFVPNTNSTQAVMVAGMKQFLTVVTTKVVPASNNSTQLAQSVISVMTAMGGAAYTGSYMDLTKTMSLSSMLNVVNSFYTMLSTVKTLGLF